MGLTIQKEVKFSSSERTTPEEDAPYLGSTELDIGAVHHWEMGPEDMISYNSYHSTNILQQKGIDCCWNVGTVKMANNLKKLQYQKPPHLKIYQ